jgi:hypothetical protein
MIHTSIARLRHVAGVSALCALLLAARSAEGQVSFEIGPSIGLYSGTGAFMSPRVIGDFGPFGATSRHSAGLLLGVHGTAWLGERFGLSAQFGTASTTVNTRGIGSQSSDPSRISAGSIQGLYRLPSSSLKGSVHLGGGVGFVRRAGDFYEGFETPTSPALALSVGSRHALGSRARIYIGFDTYLYSFALRELDGTEWDSSTPLDLTGKVGIHLYLRKPVQ